MPRKITQNEAEELAKTAVRDYINACDLQDAGQLGDVLMKLCSVAGVVMAQAEGSHNAAARLIGTGQFIAKKMPVQPATLRPMQ